MGLFEIEELHYTTNASNGPFLGLYFGVSFFLYYQELNREVGIRIVSVHSVERQVRQTLSTQKECCDMHIRRVAVLHT